MQLRLDHPEPVLETAGVTIPYDPDIITAPILTAIRNNLFEAEEAAQIPKIVENGDRVLDIGGGIGFISTLLARQSKVDHVISVEANPDLLSFMARLHRLNNITKVERRNVVLTNESVSEMTFYQRRDFWMGSLLATPNTYRNAISVPTTNLDMLLRTEKVTLIVCDIEGAETSIFAGADLSGVERIYLELHDHITGLSGIASVFAQMAKQGFAYDPRNSGGAIVLFRRFCDSDELRPYARG